MRVLGACSGSASGHGGASCSGNHSFTARTAFGRCARRASEGWARPVLKMGVLRTDAYMYTCTSSPSPTTTDFEEVENHQSWTASAPRDQFVGRSGPHDVPMQLWHSMQRVPPITGK